MFDALAAGFRAIAADRVLQVIVIGSAVLAAWLVYELVSAGRRPRGDERVEQPEPIPAPEQRVEAIVQSLRERDDRAATRKRKRRLVKAKARKRRA